MLERKLGMIRVHGLGLLLRLKNKHGWGDMVLLLEVHDIGLLLGHCLCSLLLLC